MPRLWESSSLTPHGDRELAIATEYDRVVSISLPLMGIGNWRGVRVPRPGYRLITPHGDRELLEDVLDGTAVDGASLPLMGIGNSTEFPARMLSWISLPLMGIGNMDETIFA